MPIPNIPRSSRTESIEEKVTLLRRAYQENRLDLVESLADSIKDSIQYERQTREPSAPTTPGPDDFVEVRAAESMGGVGGGLAIL